MDRLVAALAVAAPPPLAEAARAAGCPAAGIRELERTGRIVVLEPDLAYATATYRRASTATAVSLAATAPLTPATLRDATGTSRKYVMAILEDLDRRAILRRTPAGHVPGPRAAQAVGRPRHDAPPRHRAWSSPAADRAGSGATSSPSALDGRTLLDQRHRRRHPGLDRDPRDRRTRRHPAGARAT